jgi:hypothetical protein
VVGASCFILDVEVELLQVCGPLLCWVCVIFFARAVCTRRAGGLEGGSLGPPLGDVVGEAPCTGVQGKRP